MSDALKLSTALPGDQEINGLDALAAALVEDPSRMVCAQGSDMASAPRTRRRLLG